MSSPASPMRPVKASKPTPPVPPKVVAPPPPVEEIYDDDDDLPPPPEEEDEFNEEVTAPPPPVTVPKVAAPAPPSIPKKPTVSPPPPPKVSKPTPSVSTAPPVNENSLVDRKDVKSFVNPALAARSSTSPVPKPVRPISPTPPPKPKVTKELLQVESEKGPPTESEEPEDVRRGSIFTSVSHSLRKALRSSLIGTTSNIDSHSPAVVDENLIKEGMLSKMNREGKFEKYNIILRKEEFIYTQDKLEGVGGGDDDTKVEGTTATTATSVTADHDRHEIPLTSMIVL